MNTKIAHLLFCLNLFSFAHVSLQKGHRNKRNLENHIKVQQPLPYKLMLPLGSGLRLDDVDPAFALNGNATVASTNSGKPVLLLNGNLAIPALRSSGSVDNLVYHSNDVSKPPLALNAVLLSPSTGKFVKPTLVLNGNSAVPAFGLSSRVENPEYHLHDFSNPSYAPNIHGITLTGNANKPEFVMNGNIAMSAIKPTDSMDTHQYQSHVLKPSLVRNGIHTCLTSNAEEPAFVSNDNVAVPALQSALNLDSPEYRSHDVLKSFLAQNYATDSSTNKVVSLHCTHTSPGEVTCYNRNCQNNVRCVVNNGNGTINDRSVAQLVGLIYQKVIKDPERNKTVCFYLPPPATTRCPTEEPCSDTCPTSTTTENPFACCKTANLYKPIVISCDPLRINDERTTFLCNWDQEEQGVFSIPSNTADDIQNVPCWTVSLKEKSDKIARYF